MTHSKLPVNLQVFQSQVRHYDVIFKTMASKMIIMTHEMMYVKKNLEMTQNDVSMTQEKYHVNLQVYWS